MPYVEQGLKLATSRSVRRLMLLRKAQILQRSDESAGSRSTPLFLSSDRSVSLQNLGPEIAHVHLDSLVA